MTRIDEAEANDLRALTELAETVKAAYRNDDAGMYESTLAPDAIISMPGSPPVVGREALVAAFKSRPALPPGATFEVTPTELQVINGEWAYAFGTDTLTIPSVGGEMPLVQTITFMVLLRKTPEGWRTYREVLSADQKG